MSYFINLKRRQDRLNTISEHLTSLSIPFERIEAVDGKELTIEYLSSVWKKPTKRIDYWKCSGACYLSHIKMVERIIEAGIFPCMTLEDDCRFSESPIAEPGIVLLGGWVHKDNFYGAHAISFFTKEDASRWLQFLKKNKNTTDSVLNMFRKRKGGVSVYSKGFIAYQEPGYSDIEEKGMSRPTE